LTDSANVEQRVFDAIEERAGVELEEAVEIVHQRRESIRQALYRLKQQGAVETVKAGDARFFFVVRNARRPSDRRGR
jgi:predicted transcriptional regulator